MDDKTQAAHKEDAKSKTKTVTTTVTCPHCGKEHDVSVQMPESEDTPRMAWQG